MCSRADGESVRFAPLDASGGETRQTIRRVAAESRLDHRRSVQPILSSISSFARVIVRRPASRLLQSPASHLLAAEAWLCRAQDAAGSGGVSYGYTFGRGWREPYPETSGYIVPTFFRLSTLRAPSYRVRAQRIVDWLVRIQNVDGSYPNPRYGQEGIVFDTGQVLFGLVCAWRQDAEPAVLAAARRAANWLGEVADEELRWTRHEHLDTPHTYNTRTAWALLEMAALEPDDRLLAVARANLDWAVRSQRPSGFFEHCAFRAGSAPFTHNIAYTAEGLLEAGVRLREPRYLEAAKRAGDAALAHLGPDGFLPGQISVDGRARSTSCCLTGNCQLAIVWARLAELEHEDRYRDAACRALDYVMTTQSLDSAVDGIRGGISGSHPVWGRYAPMTYPNWAAKFFIDAMWMRTAWGR